MSEGTRPASAVLLMGFGGPDCLDAVGPFMCNLMGTEPPEQIVETVKRRYTAIGGRSPLVEIAGAIAKSLEEKLARAGTDGSVPVELGMCYWDPFIGDTLRDLHARGIRRVVTVSLSPFESAVSTGAYEKAIKTATVGLPELEIVRASPLREMDAFLDVLAAAVEEAVEELKESKRLLVVFTAHSLPVDDVAGADSYVSQLREAVDDIRQNVGMPAGEELSGSDPALSGVRAYGHLLDGQRWVLAFQSRGKRGGEWLGPDVEAVVEAAVAGGFKSIAVCPIGFATDHMETLYDLDVVLADRVAQLGDVRYVRARVPNDDPILIEGIAEAVRPLL